MATRNIKKENHPDYFDKRIKQLCKELDIRQIIGFGSSFCDKKIEGEEKKFLFSFPCLSYAMKYDTENFYTLVLPLGVSCVSEKKEDIEKDLHVLLDDFLSSYSFHELSMIVEISTHSLEPYRQLYALLEQVTAVHKLKGTIRIQEKLKSLEAENKRLQETITALKEEKSNNAYAVTPKLFSLNNEIGMDYTSSDLLESFTFTKGAGFAKIAKH